MRNHYKAEFRKEVVILNNRVNFEKDLILEILMIYLASLKYDKKEGAINEKIRKFKITNDRWFN